MRVCLYARYSTAGQREASISDQMRECRDFAKRQGFTVVSEFHDAAMSGNESDRPGYQRMLKAAREKRFGAVVCHELSRLSRNEAETHALREEFEWLGLHIVTATDGIDTRQASMGLLLSVRAAMAQLELRQAAERTHRGLKGRVLEGRTGGGKCYGYETVDGRRVVIEEQAVTVRAIFGMYAGGASPRSIADELNRRGVPSPGSNWKRTSRRHDSKWLASAIYGDPRRGSGILNNEVYVGTVVWNRRRSRKKVRSGKRSAIMRPRDEWVTTRDESVRIVDDATWRKVRARIEARRKQFGERVRRGLSVHAARAPGGKRRHLLSGLLKCECGASYVISGNSPPRYVCASHTNGGSAACDNSLRVTKSLAEEKVLDGVRTKLLAPDVIEHVEREVRKALRDHEREANRDQKAVRLEVSRLERVVANLLDAVSRGDLRRSPGLSDRLREAEEKLAVGRDSLRSAQIVSIAFDPGAARRYQQLVDELSDATADEPDAARDALADLLGGAIKVVPSSDRTHLVARLRLGVRSMTTGTMIDGSGGRI